MDPFIVYLLIYREKKFKQMQIKPAVMGESIHISIYYMCHVE